MFTFVKQRAERFVERLRSALHVDDYHDSGYYGSTCKLLENDCKIQAEAIEAFIQETRSPLTVVITHNNTSREIVLIAAMLMQKGFSVAIVQSDINGISTMQKGECDIYLSDLKLLTIGWQTYVEGAGLICLKPVSKLTEIQLTARMRNRANVYLNGDFQMKNGVRLNG